MSKVLNRNRGMDRIHDPDNLTEQCNTDDVVDRSFVDDDAASKLVESGEAEYCKHCMKPLVEA